MPQLTFYPLGNADCCLIDLARGEKVLFDFADVRDPSDPNDRRTSLSAVLMDNLEDADRENFDVVAFTHLDNDHISGASEFFFLEHAAKYQSGERIRIDTLWVPAAAILEEGAEDEARIIRAEARHRLKKGAGIRVFSRPNQLEEWLKGEGLSLQDRQHLITDAGQNTPEFSIETHGVEFFVHSPFAHKLDENEVIDRNADSLAMQATFLVENVATKLFLGSDLNHEALSEIVQITKARGNQARLEWDIIKLPHHCSYLSLSTEKGAEKTDPVPDVAWLFEQQGQAGAKIVSTSKPIPTNDDDPQPPHRQAANYYRSLIRSGVIPDGEFLVTMEYPKPISPKPLVIVIDGTKARVDSSGSLGAPAILSQPAPRAG